MNNDKIVQQTRENREEVLKKHDYDLHKYMESIYIRQRKNPNNYTNHRIKVDEEKVDLQIEKG
jgi:hypothetical protein